MTLSEPISVHQTKDQIKTLKAQKAKALAEADLAAREAAEQRHKHEACFAAWSKSSPVY